MEFVERFSAADESQLAEAGIALGEAERQLNLLGGHDDGSGGIRPTCLARPATVGDGIERVTEAEIPALLERAARARAAGRCLKFVPASGAASRMFRSLAAIERRSPRIPLSELAAAATGDADAREVADLLAALPEIALGRELERRRPGFLAAIERRDESVVGTVLELAFSPSHDAPPLAASPKGLLPFHWAGDRPRTAFAEQLAEGRPYLEDARGTSRLHFTVGGDVRANFEAELAAVRAPLSGSAGSFDVAFSEQRSSTHALALDESGRPARTPDGRLLLRPAGHGALLGNLEATGGDVVFVKNIDNLLPEERHAEIALWKGVLAGKLLELLERGDRSAPWRVCGVVANSGEPGGGPFWTIDSRGRTTLQIVESAEVDLRDAEQARIFRGSTHFNPVDLVVSLRDPEGRPWELDRFVDPTRAFVAEKSEGGRKLRIYERPGLWNGAMAGWNTLFVELPAWTFAPVKTLLDLARPEHRGPTRSRLH